MPCRHIIFCGPRGSGKGTLVAAMISRFPQLQRAVTHTTRLPRTGEVEGVDYLFITPEEFDQLLAQGELIDYVCIGAKQRSGPTKTQILSVQYGVFDMTPPVMLSVRRFLRSQGGDVLAIGVSAPIEQRKRRVYRRDPKLTLEQADILIAEDPVSEDSPEFKQADLVIRNDIPDDPSFAIDRAAEAVRHFLNGGDT